MLDAHFAHQSGWLVDGVTRMSFDGFPVVVLICGGDRSDGYGYAEIIVCGANVRLLGISIETARSVIAQACVYPAAEVQRWVNRLEADRRQRQRAAARRSFTA